MAPAIGRPALDNGSCGSIPGDWVALPPQNIQLSMYFADGDSEVYHSSGPEHNEVYFL